MDGRGLVVDFIRHGQSTSYIQAGRIGGRDPKAQLTVGGLRQINDLATAYLQRLGEYPIAALYCSDLFCAKQSAIELRRMLDLKEFTPAPELTELSQGKWEGCMASVVHTPKVIAQMNREGADFQSPGGESQRMTGTRLYGWLDWLRTHPPTRPGRVLAISHGSAMRCLFLEVMGLMGGAGDIRRFHIGNAHIMRLVYNLKYGRWELAGFNLASP